MLEYHIHTSSMIQATKVKMSQFCIETLLQESNIKKNLFKKNQNKKIIKFKKIKNKRKTTD